MMSGNYRVKVLLFFTSFPQVFHRSSPENPCISHPIFNSQGWWAREIQPILLGSNRSWV